MDTARYCVALFIVSTCPGVYLFWFCIHPFVAFWRRVGARKTLAIHIGMIALLAAAVVLARRWIFSIEFGTQPVLLALAALSFFLSIILRRSVSRQVGVGFLLGLPELAPERHVRRLVTTGIYSRIRHPRYVQLLLTILACALFSNYLAAWVVLAAGVLWIHAVVRVEERELRESFGKDYDTYCEHVPRFMPRKKTPRDDARSIGPGPSL